MRENKQDRAEKLLLNALEQERFCAYIEAGITGAKNLGSERRYNKAFEVYKLAKQLWRHESRIKELHDLFVR